jgi:twitching motility two-component system response regulator PilH
MILSGSVLIIDDDPNLAAVVEGYLEPKGCATHVARNGFQGLKLAREARPKVILCDMKMPHMAGTDVLRALAADPITANIPRVLMTGNVDADRSVAHGFLLKPFREADLLAVLERVAPTPPRRASLPLACEV